MTLKNLATLYNFQTKVIQSSKDISAFLSSEVDNFCKRPCEIRNGMKGMVRNVNSLHEAGV